MNPGNIIRSKKWNRRYKSPEVKQNSTHHRRETFSITSNKEVHRSERKDLENLERLMMSVSSKVKHKLQRSRYDNGTFFSPV